MIAASDGDPVEEYRAAARRWLASNARRRADVQRRGSGSDDVSVFHDLTADDERHLLDDLMCWQRAKVDAGFGAVTWPQEFGGAGLSVEYERAFREEESAFVTPPDHETFSVTVNLVAPTIRDVGTPEQRHRFLRRFLRTEWLCCQLFSEPGAGSDLAGLSTRAERDGDDWVITGQKVWQLGARFSAWGEIICRTDPSQPKHAGLTAFMIPMDSPGIEVRPIRQMSGGSSFNEVFLDSVRVPDELRLGAVGDGWRVALATLAFERATSGSDHEGGRGGSFEQVVELARRLGSEGDPLVRQRLAELYTLDRVRAMHAAWVASTYEGDPGPSGSVGKLLWTGWMTRVSEVVSELLGPRLVADTGEWGTYAWAKHVLGAPGYRIAGGTDEIQRNIIGERILGLPPEPRIDRSAAAV